MASFLFAANYVTESNDFVPVIVQVESTSFLRALREFNYLRLSSSLSPRAGGYRPSQTEIDYNTNFDRVYREIDGCKLYRVMSL